MKKEIYALVENKVVDNCLKYEDLYEEFWFYDEEQLEECKQALRDLGIELIEEKSNESIALSKDDTNDYNRIVKEYKKNRNESNLKLCRLIQEGDQLAERILCEVNVGLVIKFAKKYYKVGRNQLDFEDLKQTGMLGLIKAARRFDFSYNIAFSTYTVYWIKQSILREINNDGFTIRVPVNKMEKIQKYKEIDEQLSRELSNRQQRKKAVAKELGCSVNEVEKMDKIYHNIIFTTSLNTPVKTDEMVELGAFVEDDSFEKPEERWDKVELRIELLKALDNLDEKEKEILLLRYGFYDGKTHTLNEVGQKFHVTRERVRQIEKKALNKLKNPKIAKILEEYLGEI